MNCTPALSALVLGFRAGHLVPYWEWAQDFPQLKGDLKMAPSEYVRRNGYFTCEADEKDRAGPIREPGEDHILMATDYPHFDSEYPRTVSAIRERSDISAKPKDKILGENAARLVKL